MTTETKTKTRVRSQIHIEDVVIENAELSEALEAREEKKREVAGYRFLDKKARELIAKMDPSPPFRIGRFVITKKTSPARSVNFETTEGTRITIKLLGDE